MFAPAGTIVKSFTNGRVSNIRNTGKNSGKVFGTQVSIKGDTGMYEFDFVSVVAGYILGVLLYNSIGNILFLEKDHEDQ